MQSRVCARLACHARDAFVFSEDANRIAKRCLPGYGRQA